jgi:hypothetical protein
VTKGIQLTERDRKLLVQLGEYGCFSTRQIERLFFSGVHSSTVLRRLRKLHQSRWIVRHADYLGGGGLVWSLSDRAAVRLGISSTLERINRNALEHTLTISEVHWALESAGILLEWKPESVLLREALEGKNRRHRDRQNVPDGIAVLPGKPDGVITAAIEVELHLKGRTRYEQVFSACSRSNGLSILWYIVPQERLGKAIEGIWNGFVSQENRSKFVWSLTSEILGNLPTARLRRQTKSLLLADVVQFPAPKAQGVELLLPAQPSAHPGSTPGDFLDGADSSEVVENKEKYTQISKEADL